MSLNHPLANVLATIFTYEKLGKREVVTANNSKFIRKVLTVLQENKYLGGLEEVEDGKSRILKVNLIGAINKVGVVKPRFAVKLSDMEKYEKRFLPAKNFGIILMSTNKGLLTHIEAKERKLGGKLVCYCY